MRTPWTGAGTALVTPFTPGGDLDEARVRSLARRQVEAGIHFVAPCGTTGENPTLTPAEREALSQRAIQHVRTHFTRERMCAETLAVYHEVLAERAAGTPSA